MVGTCSTPANYCTIGCTVDRVYDCEALENSADPEKRAGRTKLQFVPIASKAFALESASRMAESARLGKCEPGEVSTLSDSLFPLKFQRRKQYSTQVRYILDRLCGIVFMEQRSGLRVAPLTIWHIRVLWPRHYCRISVPRLLGQIWSQVTVFGFMSRVRALSKRSISTQFLY